MAISLAKSSMSFILAGRIKEIINAGIATRIRRVGTNITISQQERVGPSRHPTEEEYGQ